MDLDQIQVLDQALVLHGPGPGPGPGLGPGPGPGPRPGPGLGPGGGQTGGRMDWPVAPRVGGRAGVMDCWADGPQLPATQPQLPQSQLQPQLHQGAAQNVDPLAHQGK